MIKQIKTMKTKRTYYNYRQHSNDYSIQSYKTIINALIIVLFDCILRSLLIVKNIK